MARQVADAPVAGEQRIPMTYEEWLAWPQCQSKPTEWVDGEVIVLPMPDEPHQDIAGFRYVLLSWYARALGLGKVILAPFEMRLSSLLSREPDIIFVAREHAGRLDGNRLDGPADLAVEIVSPDSVHRDRREKLAEYAALGVRECWVLDSRPGRYGAEFFRLMVAGRYEPVAGDADGLYRSKVRAGFWFRPEWLWREPLPDPVGLWPRIAPEAWRSAMAAVDPE